MSTSPIDKPRLPPVTLALSVLFTPGLILLFAALLAAVAGMGFALYKMFENSESVPLYPFLILAVVAYAVLRAAFASFRRPPSSELAILADKASLGDLGSLIDSVADRVGSKRPHNVLLGYMSNFYVTSGRVRTLPGQVVRGRTLHLSAPLLQVLSRDQVEAILAHEFAHFTGGDTVYSLYALPVYQSCLEGFNRLKAELFAPVRGIYGLVLLVFRLLYVPPMLLILGYYTLFLVVDRRMSRARELRADAIASSIVGRETFQNALAMAVTAGLVWDGRANSLLTTSGQTAAGVSGGFRALLEKEQFSTEGVRLLATAIGKPESTVLSTHPALSQRLHGLDLGTLTLPLAPESETLLNGYITQAQQQMFGEMDRRVGLARVNMAAMGVPPGRPSPPAEELLWWLNISQGPATDGQRSLREIDELAPYRSPTSLPQGVGAASYKSLEKLLGADGKQMYELFARLCEECVGAGEDDKGVQAGFVVYMGMILRAAIAAVIEESHLFETKKYGAVQTGGTGFKCYKASEAVFFAGIFIVGGDSFAEPLLADLKDIEEQWLPPYMEFWSWDQEREGPHPLFDPCHQMLFQVLESLVGRPDESGTTDSSIADHWMDEDGITLSGQAVYALHNHIVNVRNTLIPYVTNPD